MATKKAPKALTKCEECGTRLPVHLLGLAPPGGKGLKHICSCTAAYTEQAGEFVRTGNERNLVVEYDEEQKAKKKAAKEKMQ